MDNSNDKIYNWKIIDDFTFNDLICLNNSLSVKLFSTQSNIFKESLSIDFYSKQTYSDYVLYEIIQNHWPYPIRLFYNKQIGISYSLNGSNDPIYKLNKLSRIFEVKRKVDKDDLNEKCIKYIRMFFDNVEGRHGMFHIFESYTELEYVVKLHYQLEPEKIREYKERSDKALIKKLVRESIFEFGNNKEKGFNIRLVKNETTENIFKRIYGVYMLFQGDIFYAHVVIETNSKEDKWGEIIMNNEVQALRYDRPTKTKHELQLWEQSFSNFGYESYLPPIHIMQINPV